MSNFKQSYVIKIQYDLPDGSNVGEAPNGNSNAGSSKAAKYTSTVLLPVTIAQPFISAALQARAQEISTITGSSQLARRHAAVALGVNTTTSLVKIAGSAVGGFIAGTVVGGGNPAAGAIGAAVSAGLSAIRNATDVATGIILNTLDLQNKRNAETSAIAAGRARAGISWNRSRER